MTKQEAIDELKELLYYWKIMGDRVGDFIDKVLGVYNSATTTAGNAALTRELAKEGMSSGGFDQLGRSISANKNILK